MNGYIIPIGCDHAGHTLKEAISKHLITKGFKLQDFGCFSEDSIDYPDYAHPVAEFVSAD